ncbi:MAG TPA: alpha/beta hydrolase [Micromonosporaceae bacterium]
MSQVRPEFLDAYDAMLARWPVDVESVDVPGRLGTTHVNMCGPAGAPAIVLLHGGGATSTVWYGNVGPLAVGHRVYAIDAIGDRGRSVYNGTPIGGRDGLMSWLDETLDSVGVRNVAMIVGHSYGAWQSMHYTLQAPDRVRRVALLDPTECFIPVSLRFKLRAIPLAIRPSPATRRSFYRWEMHGRTPDVQWFELAMMRAGGRGALVWPRRPAVTALRSLSTPTLVMVAGRSRQQSPTRLAAKARNALSDVRVTDLPDASHFSMPTEHPGEINAALEEFLAVATPEASPEKAGS